MLKKLWATAAAVGGLVVAGTATAGDEAVRLGRFTPPAGETAGTAVGPGPASDTELTHWHRGGWGGYGWGGGWGYSSFYRPYWGGGWGGWGGGWGYSSFYQPGFAVSYYSAPRFYSPWWGGYYAGGFFPISGTNVSVNTPAVQLNLAIAPRSPAVATPAARPSAQPAPGGYQYDGGPTNPVPPAAPAPTPAPAPQADPAPATDATAMRVARPAAKPAYKYTAYGEAR